MTTESPITALRGVGEAQAKKFAVLGIATVGDLINHYPRRYEDYSEISSIASLQPGKVTLAAEIKQVGGRYVRRGMHITEAVASDDTGSVRLVWFNQPYRPTSLKSGQQYYISGDFQLRRQRFVITNPSVELVSDLPVNTARILPVYRETKNLNSRQIRAAVAEARPVISALHENLPDWIVRDQSLTSHAQALRALHLPESGDDLSAARKRLGFEEVFSLTLASLLNKQENQTEPALRVTFREQLAKDFVKHLPFELTDAQRRTIWQIYQDMGRPEPMNRLVEGDVGAGKTVVAAMAAIMVLAHDMQVALMAPTELLARQHADTLHSLLKPLGYEKSVGLLVGSMTQTQKTVSRKKIATGETGFIVGTHALIQEKVDMSRLALVIIDEQHRFGVEQRKTLMAKAGHMPHVLSLTATPIPRSLALTLYGELDISLLDQKPAGRKPVSTEIVPPSGRDKLYGRIDKEVEAGRQVFVVCPLITESDAFEARSADQVYEQLSQHEFKRRRVGLLHGKMKAADKQAVMEKFVTGKLDVLVSTTVIEVGVDVPNATVMVIESAERFGLAQLHQLRGRVGRGQTQAHCFLMLSDSQQPTRRLRAMESSNDGFKLAELDLELRGPGAIYGTSQHGALDLRIAKLTDTHLIASARKCARQFLDQKEDLLQYKQLADTVNRLRAVTNLN